MNSLRRVLWTTIFFFLVLAVFHLLWIAFYSTRNQPVAVAGVMDLRDYGLPGDKLLMLDGQWSFYPNVLLSPQGAEETEEPAPELVQVPGTWKDTSITVDEQSFAYGTFRLRILLPREERQKLGLAAANIRLASAVYVDGSLLFRSGTPAVNLAAYDARNVPQSGYFMGEKDEIDIVIHVSSEEFIGKTGGILKSLSFGTEKALNKHLLNSNMAQTAVFTLLALLVLLPLMIYLLGGKKRLLLVFAAAGFCGITSLLLSDERLLLKWLPMINYEWTTKLIFTVYVCAAALFLHVIIHMLFGHSASRLYRVYVAVIIVYCVSILLLPLRGAYMLLPVFGVLLAGSALAIPVLIVLANRKQVMQDGIFLLLAGASAASNVIWGGVNSSTFLNIGFYPLDLTVAFLSLVAYALRQYFRNVDYTAELSRKLQKADKLKDDFLANTSHELRNPLHGMINMAQSVLDREKGRLKEQSVHNLELLVTVGSRMSLLLNDLLDLSQLKESSLQLQPGSIRLQPVASGVIGMLKYMTENKPVEIEMQIAEQFPPVWADETRLVQIMFNLVHNAVKFTLSGSVVLSADMEDGWALVHVSDTGIGMDEETQERIFQPYEQGDSSITAIGGGIGLGLSISRQLVELHGGWLRVQSLPGQGSVFTFALPLSRQEPSLEQSAVPPSRPNGEETPEIGRWSVPRRFEARDNAEAVSNRSRVLIVDDDPVNLKVLEGILSVELYDIASSGSGREAVDRIHEAPWDLIIADVMMPQMSGYELTQIVRRQFSLSELPILLLTARSRAEDIYSGFLSGANDYVSKPVNPLELRARVRALTELRKSVGEALRLEGAFLQAQIQPHFLFNAMNAITALSEIDMDRMRSMIDAFSSYLRISFDFMSSERLVPLEHELELVRSYLYIEKERFADRLEVVWELGEATDVLLPPLSIQPLVENAVRHGILSRSKGGRVLIRIVCRENRTAVSISDNGVGMDAAKLSQLFRSAPNKRRGIGLVNTDRRLKQLYGKGLQIESRLGTGTTVSFVIPQ